MSCFVSFVLSIGPKLFRSDRIYCSMFVLVTVNFFGMKQIFENQGLPTATFTRRLTE